MARILMIGGIRILKNDPQMRMRMGRNSRELAEKYSWLDILKQTAEVYDKVIAVQSSLHGIAENSEIRSPIHREGK